MTYFRYACPKCGDMVPSQWVPADDSCPSCGTYLFPTRPADQAERSTFRPGERLVDGQVMYSAAWLDPPAVLTENQRRRAR